MTKEEIEKRIYKAYLFRISLILNKKRHWIAKKYSQNEIEFCDQKISACFNVYEDMRSLLFDFPEYYKEIDSTKADKFVSAHDTPENTFPCIGTFVYKNVEYPVFMDDYAMTDFIEVDGKTVDLNWDWWYAIDCYRERDVFLDTDTVEKCDKVLDQLYKTIDEIMLDRR